MNFIVLPTRNDLPWYRFKITLSGVIYTLRMRYNTRMKRWIADIADTANNDILNGIPLLVSRNLNNQFVIDGLPVGTLFVSDDTNQNEQPTANSFGKDKTLFYADPTAPDPFA